MRLAPCLAVLLAGLPFVAVAQSDMPIRVTAAKAAPGEGRTVQVDLATLAGGLPGQEVVLPGRKDQPVTARVRSAARGGDGRLAWTATVDTPAGPQTATIVERGGHVFGWLPQPDGGGLRLETRHGTSRLVDDADSQAPSGPDVLLPPLPDAQARELRRRQEAEKSGGTPRADVLVAYQPSLVELWGSVAAVQARIAYLETITNQAYADSDMDLTVRVVGTHLLDVPARLDNHDALYMITDASALAVKQEIDRVRALYGADLVKLMRNFDRVNQNSCGVGWLGGYRGNPFYTEYGFSVTADLGFGTDRCGEWTFSHELGHNQGAHHDTETTLGDYGAFVYSRGHRRTLDASSGFATVMAYNTGPQSRIGQYSNPRQSLCLGVPCGIEGEADNARGIAETAALVAAMLPEPATSALPELTIEDVVVTEGNSGRKPANFVLRLSAPAAGAVAVSFATRAASATNADFVPRTGSVQIQPGQTSVTVAVDVRGDTLAEPDEVFALDLLSATGARIVRHQGVATIASDDPLPVLSIAEILVGEGDHGSHEAVFTATLSAASNAPVLFDVATGQYGGGSAAAMGYDFEPMQAAQLQIPPGARATQFTVTIHGDVEEEGTESFYVAVGGVQGATIANSIIQARIQDDDAPGLPAMPGIRVAGTTVVEGNGGWREVPVTVTLDAPSTQEVRFALHAESITATAGADFDATGLGLVVIPAGQVSVQASLRIHGDLIDEADEVLVLRLANVVGATPAGAAARVVIQDDDGSPDTAPLVARDDRFVLRENAGPVRLAVLANDAVAPAALAGASLLVSTQPVVGTVQVDTNATAGTAADDVLVYTPAANRWYEDALSYRLCEATGRCTDGVVQVVVRPFADVEVDSATGSGFLDQPVQGLRALPDLRVGSSPGHASTRQVVALEADTTPETPWDGEGVYERIDRLGFPYMPGGSPPSALYYRRLVDAHGLGATDVDLYLGLDDNGNGRADPGETRCVAAMGTPVERCELNLVVPPGGEARSWVLVHNRQGQAIEAVIDLWDIDKFPGPSPFDSFIATAPGNVPAGEAFPVRVSWHQPTGGPGTAFAGLVAMEDRATGETAWVPVRIDRTAAHPGPAQVQHDGMYGVERTIPGGGTDELLFFDLPEGVQGVDLHLYGAVPMDLHLARGTPDNAGAGIAPAPARAAAEHVFTQADGTITLGPGALAAGRWYLTLTNPSPDPQNVFVQVDHQAQAPPLAWGSYFNPQRSGHGLFVYPAGNQVVGLWYTYLQDGTPTWYYLQGGAPGNGGQWHSPLYRAIWDGGANTLHQVGQATATVQADGLLFSYRLDGETGSELLVPLGAGCPTLGGQPLDASSHWFDPARAGTGYSVQMFPDYEFYAAFVYDARGMPRFLTSEAGSFLGADASLPLEQLTGFCPLCQRSGSPTRTDIGTLRRRFDATGLVRMELDAVYTGGVPGTWTGNDQVQALGGPGTTQGCPAP